MNTNPAVVQHIGVIKSVVEFAAFQSTRKAFSKRRLRGLMKQRARSENQHNELMVFDFTKEVHVEACAPFWMPRDLCLPMVESI